jgi:hypothetical protein
MIACRQEGILNKLFEDDGQLFLQCCELKKVWRLITPEQLRVKFVKCTSRQLGLMHEVLSLENDTMMTTVVLFW